MRMLRSTPVLVLVLCVLLHPAAAGERPIVAVFGIQGKDAGLPGKLLKSLTDYLGTAVSEGGVYRVVPSEDIRRALLQKKKESYKACYDQKCQIELGRELAANKSLSTTILRLGEQCVVTARMYDLRSQATDTSAKASGGCDQAALLTSLDRVALNLRRFAQGLPPLPGPGTVPAAGAAAGAGSETPMVAVPAGTFRMGSPDGTGEDNEHPSHQVELDGFYADKFEVSVRAYKKCVADDECTPPADMPRCNYHQAGRGSHPVNCVSWEQARVFCAWAGKRLCTEAEWEKAARGTDGRLQPWGGEPASCKLAVMSQGGDGCGKLGTSKVGKRPGGASPYQAMDMVGNVWEWVADYYDPGYYETSPARNPSGPAAGSKRVIRGGGFSSRRPAATQREGMSPRQGIYFVGFRCCR